MLQYIVRKECQTFSQNIVDIHHCQSAEGIVRPTQGKHHDMTAHTLGKRSLYVLLQTYEKFGHEARMTTTFQLLNSLKMGVTLRDAVGNGNEEVGTSKRENERSLICKASFYWVAH